MPQASGLFKQLARKRESVYGAAAGAAAATMLRRVTSDLSLNKAIYQSAELRTDQQVGDMRHGARSVEGTIAGELSPGTYADELSALLRRNFTTGAQTSGLSLTITGAGPTYTITRASGNWLTDGFKRGKVVRLSGGSLSASNVGKNLLIQNVTSSALTVRVVNGSALQSQGPIASCVCTVVGKETWAPTAGHTDVSYNYEHWHADIAQNELFVGVQPTRCDVALPPTGMATVNISMVGKDIIPSQARYFSAPSVSSSTGICAAVNGVVLIGGQAVAVLTGLSFTIESPRAGDPVVGSNTIPTRFPGRISVSGQATAYFENATLRDQFLNDVDAELIVVLTSDNTAASDFVAFTMPRVKFGGASKNDGESGIVQTLPFTALLPVAGGAGVGNEMSTIVVQDSAAFNFDMIFKGQSVCDWQPTSGTLALVSATSGEAVELDPLVLCDGLPMLRCTQAATGTFVAEFVFSTPLTLSQMRTLQIPLRFSSNNVAWAGSTNSLQLWFWNDATGTSQWRIGASLRALDGTELRPGATHVISMAAGAADQGWTFGGTNPPTNTSSLDVVTVNRLRVTFANIVAGEKVWIGELRANGRRAPVVSVVLDGQYISQHDYILPALEAYGLRCSLAIQGNQIGQGGRMSLEQLHRAYGAGHEIISWGYDPKTGAGYRDATDWPDAASITADLVANANLINSQGWVRGIGYAVHGGTMNPYNTNVTAARQAIVTQGYEGANIKAIRRGSWAQGALQRLQSVARPAEVHPYSVSGALQWTNTDNAASLTAVATRAKARGEWGIITGHRSVVSGAGSLEILNSDLLTWAQTLGADHNDGTLQVMPFGEACRYYGVTV